MIFLLHLVLSLSSWKMCGHCHMVLLWKQEIRWYPCCISDVSSDWTVASQSVGKSTVSVPRAGLSYVSPRPCRSDFPVLQHFILLLQPQSLITRHVHFPWQPRPFCGVQVTSSNIWMLHQEYFSDEIIMLNIKKKKKIKIDKQKQLGILSSVQIWTDLSPLDFESHVRRDVVLGCLSSHPKFYRSPHDSNLDSLIYVFHFLMYSNLPLSAVLLSAVSLTHGQPWYGNVRWKILEINNS